MNWRGRCTAASCRNRKFKSLENEQNSVRFTPNSGHYANIDLNYRFVLPKAAISLQAHCIAGVRLVDSAKLNDWMQVIGLFGVLGGLIFVGMQLRLDRQVAVADRVSQTQVAVMYWAELVNEHPEIWAKGRAGDQLSDLEAIQFEALADAWEINHWSAWIKSQQLGLTAPERFVRETAVEIYTHPGLMAYWRRHTSRFRQTRDTGPEINSGGWMDAVDEEIRHLEQEGAR